MWYWRLAIFECVTDAFIAMSMVWVAAVADKAWTDLSPTARHVIEISAVVAGLKVVKSFLSTTMQVLKSEMPIPDDGTGNLTKTVQTTQTSTVSVAQTTAPPVPIPSEPAPDHALQSAAEVIPPKAP